MDALQNAAGMTSSIIFLNDSQIIVTYVRIHLTVSVTARLPFSKSY